MPRNKVRDAYRFVECPDCGEDIPKDVIEGDACSNCGHVFCANHKCDNGTCLDCYAPLDKCICAPKVKGL